MKKLFILLTLFISQFLLGNNVFSAEIPVEKVFTDIDKNYKYYNELQTLYNKGMIFPDEDGRFNPNKLLNRDEFVGISMEIACKKCISPNTDYSLIKEYSSTKTFYDVNKDNKYFYCIAESDKKGYVKGYYEGFKCEGKEKRKNERPFCIDNKIKFDEALAIVLRNSGIFTIEDNKKVLGKIYSGEINKKLSDDVYPKNKAGQIYTFYGYLRKALSFELKEIDKNGKEKIYKLLELKNNKINPGKNISKEEFLIIAYIVLNSNSCTNEEKKELTCNEIIGNTYSDKIDKVRKKIEKLDSDRIKNILSKIDKILLRKNLSKKKRCILLSLMPKIKIKITPQKSEIKKIPITEEEIITKEKPIIKKIVTKKKILNKPIIDKKVKCDNAIKIFTIMSSDGKKCKNFKNEWYAEGDVYDEGIGYKKRYYKCTKEGFVVSNCNVFNNSNYRGGSGKGKKMKYYQNYLCNNESYLGNPISDEYACISPLGTVSYTLLSTLGYSCIDIDENKAKTLGNKNKSTKSKRELGLSIINKDIKDIKLYNNKIRNSRKKTDNKSLWEIKIRKLKKQKKQEEKKISAMTREVLQWQKAIGVKQGGIRENNNGHFFSCSVVGFYGTSDTSLKTEIIEDKKVYNKDTDNFIQKLENKDKCKDSTGFKLKRELSGIVIKKMEILSSCENYDFSDIKLSINNECKEWGGNGMLDWYTNIRNIKYTCQEKEVEDNNAESDEEKEILAAKKSAYNKANKRCQKKSDDAVKIWKENITKCLNLAYNKAKDICPKDDEDINYNDCVESEEYKQKRLCYEDEEYSVFEDYINAIDYDEEIGDVKDKELYNYGAVCELEYSNYGGYKDELYKFEWIDAKINSSLNSEETNDLNKEIEEIKKKYAEEEGEEEE